ncbi:MAG: hypothetical protein ACLTXR_05980 [Clostridia bacterium]
MVKVSYKNLNKIKTDLFGKIFFYFIFTFTFAYIIKFPICKYLPCWGSPKKSGEKLILLLKTYRKMDFANSLLQRVAAAGSGVLQKFSLDSRKLELVKKL